MAYSQELVTHNFTPIFDANSRVLMLGTMPSPKSREVGFYYGHPRNRFWKVVSDVFWQGARSGARTTAASAIPSLTT